MGLFRQANGQELYAGVGDVESCYRPLRRIRPDVRQEVGRGRNGDGHGVVAVDGRLQCHGRSRAGESVGGKEAPRRVAQRRKLDRVDFLRAFGGYVDCDFLAGLNSKQLVALRGDGSNQRHLQFVAVTRQVIRDGHGHPPADLLVKRQQPDVVARGGVGAVEYLLAGEAMAGRGNLDVPSQLLVGQKAKLPRTCARDVVGDGPVADELGGGGGHEAERIRRHAASAALDAERYRPGHRRLVAVGNLDVAAET